MLLACVACFRVSNTSTTHLNFINTMWLVALLYLHAGGESDLLQIILFKVDYFFLLWIKFIFLLLFLYFG